MKLQLRGYDIFASFGRDSIGRSSRHLIRFDGKQSLDTEIWKAGEVAYQLLLMHFPEGIDESGYATWVRETDDLLQKDFYPAILKRFNAGEFTINPPLESRSFADVWSEYDWVDRALVLIQFIEESDPAWSMNEEMKSWVGSMVALALLWRLDDAVISECLDGRGMPEIILDIASLKDRLQYPQYVSRAIEVAKRDASKNMAASGGVARHAKSNAAREFVRVEWAANRHEYENNKTAFSRDYVRRVKHEFDATVTEKQMREVWLKDTPSAS